MTDRYFPIRTETACQLKWAWSTVRLYTGLVSSCHRVDQTQISAANFDDFHNTERNLRHRSLMLDGQWPSEGCEYCEQIERAGGSSDRLHHLQIPGYVPPELESDAQAIKVTPTILEVYFDNVCNQSCIYCWDGFSSQIQQENIRFGRFEKNGVTIQNVAVKSAEHAAITQKLWDWIITNGKSLRRINVLGGEPLYQDQFYTLLDLLQEHAMPDLELDIITNLNMAPDRLAAVIDRIDGLRQNGHIRRLDVTASIDGFGAQQEYIRYPMDLEKWRANFQSLVVRSWVVLNINQTLTSLILKTVPDLLRFVNEARQHREIGHYFSTPVRTATADIMHPGIFGPNYFRQEFGRILALMPEQTWQQQRSKEYMLGIQKDIDSRPRQSEKILQLQTYLDEIDRRRNLSWRTLFPWLEKELQHVV